MKRISKYIFIVLASIFIIFVADCIYAESGDAGGAGAYLRVGVGARALGMGGAFIAIADDAYATFWNPAGLPQLQSPQIGSMYAILSVDRKFNFLNYAQPFAGSWGWGVSWINFGVGDIERRDDDGELKGKFDDSENAIYLSLGKRFPKRIYLGLNFKYLLHKLADNEANGFGFDIGLLYKPINLFSVGVVFQDIGTYLKWNTSTDHKDRLPLNTRIGTALRLVDDKLILSTDLDKNENQSLKFHGGAEYWLAESFGARIGYDDDEFTAGASFKISHFQVDYGFATDKLDEGNSHRFSLLLSF